MSANLCNGKGKTTKSVTVSLLGLCCLLASPAWATTVKVAAPASGASVSGAVTVQASASSANPIDGWHIYDNGADVFSAVGVSSINASLNLASGNHTLVVRAWDNTGSFGDQTVNITVTPGNPPPPPIGCGSTPTVTLTTPQSGTTVTAPVNVQAAACSANPIAGWHIYDNGADLFNAAGVGTINASLSLAAGSHTLVVRAWDNTGSFGDQTVNITVTPGNPPPPPIACGSTPTVTVTSPQSGSTVSAPLKVQAAACSSHPIDGWHIYDNGADIFSTVGVSSINALLSLGAGSHALVIRAWDNTGSFGSQTVSVTVNGGAAAVVPASNHVYLVVLENHSFNQVIGNVAMPNLNNMAGSYGLAAGYFANAHPSIGNYLEMTTGQTITNDDAFTATISVDNIVRHLLTAGKTWKEYSEDIPNVGYTGGDSGLYIQHHNPLAYFSDVRGTVQQNNLVPFTQLQADIAAGTLPAFGLIVPNNCDNAHDCSLNIADSWLQNKVFQPLLNTPAFQANGDGLLIVVFDEGDQADIANGGGQVAAVLIGPKVKNGFQSTTFYQHQSLLRTIDDALGLSGFGDAATARPMAEFFK